MVVGEARGHRAKGQEGNTGGGGSTREGEAGTSRTRPMGPSPRQDMPHKCCRKEETFMVKTRHTHGVKGAGGEDRHSIYVPSHIPLSLSCPHHHPHLWAGLSPASCLLALQGQATGNVPLDLPLLAAFLLRAPVHPSPS